ncbi:MAG TPA: NAD+ synthase [Solirubrobacterales bacterium]|nr:NAD+ synthase [Solirubrobacterales bacterium]
MSSAPQPSTRSLRIALAQINPTVGDIDGNAALASEWIGRARGAGADLVLLPELVITGYPPEDLLLKRHFVDAALAAVAEVAKGVDGIVALLGAPDRDPALHNALHVLSAGAVAAVYHKVLLPNYGVFDERRYFEPGRGAELLDLGGVRVGPTVCEDIWLPGPPTSVAALAGAELILNASASPYHWGKGGEREEIVAARARENGVAVALCNAVGGQDELVFDGHSVVVDAEGRTLARGSQFEEQLIVCDLELAAGERPGAEPDRAPTRARVELGDHPPRDPAEPPLAPALSNAEEVYRALTLGLRDYVGKNGFGDVVLGLSGGIDSALVALLAADAVGPERVRCVIMPSPHSSSETQGDAAVIAGNLGCETIELGIAPIMAAFDEALADRFAGTESGIAEENLQARIRGTLVMALSNKFGWLPLTTGNKSEMAVGYATLYGDMAGGFAVIKDVPKTLAYDLVRFRNELAGRELVPASVIERPPTAELRPDQRDSDSLPPYEVLDAALEEYVERDGGVETLVSSGIEEDVARRVIALVDRAEYKRRQAPPGVKITPKAFGRDRRLPITNRFGR